MRLPVVLSLSVLLSGCAFFAAPKAGRGNAVAIGVLSSFSGTSAENGPGTRNGVQLAIDRINAAGGVLGRRMALVYADDRSDRTAAPAAAADLLNKGVVAIVGANSSSITRSALLETAVPRGIAMISPSATSPSLTDPAQVDAQGWFFRTVPNDGLQGKVLAAKAAADGHARLAVIHVDSAYGQGFAKSLKAAFEATPGHAATLVPYAESAQPKATYRETIDAALDAAPDALVLIGYPGEATVMMGDWYLGSRGKDLRWYYGDGLQDRSFPANVADGQALEGQLGTAPATDPGFAATYKAAFGGEPSFESGTAFDATLLVALAIEAARSTERSAIRDALRAVSAGGEKVGPEDVAGALAAARGGRDVDYDGYAGPVDFDAHGDVTSGRYDLWTVKDRQIVSTGEVLTP